MGESRRARGAAGEEEARRLSTGTRYARTLPGSQASVPAQKADPGSDASSTRGDPKRKGRIERRRSARGETKNREGKFDRKDGAVKRRRSSRDREEAKNPTGSAKKREAKRRRASSSSSSSSSGSDRSPSPPPPPPAPPLETAPAWCWVCRVLLARPVEEPVAHLCVCLACSAGGNVCPLCNTMVWVDLLTTPEDEDDGADQRNLFFLMLRGTAHWNLHYDPPSLQFDTGAIDGSDAHALPLLLVKARCDDCRRRPAVWSASCCGCVLCPSCLPTGLRRRHGPCRKPGVLGLLRYARATFVSLADPATYYLFKEVRLSLRVRVGPVMHTSTSSVTTCR